MSYEAHPFMNRLTVLLIFASLCFGLPASANEQDVTDRRDRFQLWNNCEPMELVVENLSDDAAKIGLTRETILTTVRSRLRAARLYSDQRQTGYLYVNIHVVGQSHHISIEYRKWVMDFTSAEKFLATTWDISGTGTHVQSANGQSSSFILSHVSRKMDKFIDEYLRVNTLACKP